MSTCEKMENRYYEVQVHALELFLTYYHDECVERFLKAWEKTGMDDNEDEVIRMQIREGYCTPLVEMVARRRALIGPGQHQRQQLQQQQRQEQHLEIN